MRATRRDLLLGGGAAALLVPAAAARAAAPGDAALLAGLLELERRLEGAYDAALRDGLFDAPTARKLRDQEREHARGLESALARLGRRPPQAAAAPPPRLRPGEPFPRFALDLESKTITAYLDALARLRNDRLLLPLGSIAANQGQHAVILRRALGEQPLEGSLAVH